MTESNRGKPKGRVKTGGRKKGCTIQLRDWINDVLTSSRTQFKKDLKQPYVQYEIICLGTELLGFIGYRQLFDEVELTNIAVHPKVQGQGLSQAFLVQWIKKLHQARVVHLEVRKSNQVAIHVYKKVGFKLINIRQDYYDYPVEDAVIMNLEIKEE